MPLIKSISGIRGTIGGNTGENLTPIDIVKFTAAYVTMIADNSASTTSTSLSTSSHNSRKQKTESSLTFSVIVGRDARVSGVIISSLVCATLQSMGVDVIDVGLSTTPTIEMAVVKHEAAGGIIITASHNPMEWNALKLLNENGEFISADEGKRLLEIAEKEDFSFAPIEKLGSYTKYENAIEDHINEILKLDLVEVDAIREANFSVIFDAVNSTGGIAIPMLLEKLGVSNYEILYGEPTGIFSHNPEPLPENLVSISEAIRSEQYVTNGMKRSENHTAHAAFRSPHTAHRFDVGFAVDPDVDRLSIVMENGEMFGEEYTLVIIADYVLRNKKGDTVSNLSSTRALREVSEKHGVNYFAAAVGEVNVVEKMKETNAIIGGEGNGGVILPELHYGRDALLGIALFLSFMAKTKLKCSEIKALYPNYVIVKNKIELTKEINIQELLQKVTQKYAAYNPNTIDGVRIDFETGWVHLRPSNTEPIIRIYAEAETQEEAINIMNEVKMMIR